MLRWFWWRINASAELAAIICGFFIGFTTSVVPVFRVEDYGIKLLLTTVLTAIVWLITLSLTPPESEEVLEKFVRLVRPPGPGWMVLRKRLRVVPLESLQSLIFRFLLGVGILFGLLFTVGSFLLNQERGGWIALVLAVFCIFAMKKKLLIKSL